jgi:hypothetical protein
MANSVDLFMVRRFAVFLSGASAVAGVRSPKESKEIKGPLYEKRCDKNNLFNLPNLADRRTGTACG